MASQKKGAKGRFQIALTAEAAAKVNKQLPAFEIKPEDRQFVIKLLRDISAGNVGQIAKLKLPKDPVSKLAPKEPGPLTERLRAMFLEAQDINRRQMGMEEAIKNELLSANLISQNLAKNNQIKLGNEIISIRQFLSMAMDAIGNRTTSGKEDSVGRAINQRGGVFFEFFIPLFSEVQQAEKKAALANIKFILTKAKRENEIDSAVKVIEEHYAGIKNVQLPEGLDPEKISPEQKFELVNRAFALFGQITPDIRIFRETELRASGKEVSDYATGFMVKLNSDTVRITPNSIGESKFKSVTPDLIPQMIETVSRISKLPLGAEFLSGVKKVEVEWGKSVLTILQSEVDPPAAQFEQYESKLRRATGSKNLSFSHVRLTKPDEAANARKIIKIFVDLATKYKAQENSINKNKPTGK